MKLVIVSVAVSVAAFMCGYCWPTKPVVRQACPEQKQKLISTVEQEGYLVCRYLSGHATYGRAAHTERIKR